MKPTKKTKPTTVKLVTRNNAPTPTSRLGRPRKTAIQTPKEEKQVTVVNNTTIALNFLEKAKQTTEKVASKTPKMFYVSPTSLKNIKWLKQDETLNFLPGVQRKMILAHSNVLTNSIQLYGFVRPVIVVEIDFIDNYMRKYIVDAQHGLMACMRLGIPIPYIVIPNINNYDDLTNLVSTLNSSAKPWKQTDYVNAWAQSKEDYRQLIFLKNKYNLDFDVVMTASTGGNDGGVHVKALKAGNFKMEDFAKSELACNRVSNLLTIIPTMDRWSTRALTRAAIIIFSEATYTNAKHKTLMAYVKENADQLKFCASKKEIALEFLRKGI